MDNTLKKREEHVRTIKSIAKKKAIFKLIFGILNLFHLNFNCKFYKFLKEIILIQGLKWEFRDQKLMKLKGFESKDLIKFRN